VFTNVIYELLVFLLGPSSFIGILLLTARFPHYSVLNSQTLEMEKIDQNDTKFWEGENWRKVGEVAVEKRNIWRYILGRVVVLR
jgi:hypothetical protein